MVSKATIVFLRVPEKGKVKTRLGEFLDQAFVLKMYKGFVEDVLEAIETIGVKALFFYPSDKKNLLENWLGKKYDFYRQKGDDLGQRIANAFKEIFKKGYTQVILIGTDIPELSRDIIISAHIALEKKDVVIGPSGDGGYYLIGFQKTSFSTSVFKDIDWSTRIVFDQTLRAIKKENLQYEILSQLNDIDTLEDLNALACRLKSGGKSGKRTFENLRTFENPRTF
jgi:rSAM/selenodomain-associated transferase 1